MAISIQEALQLPVMKRTRLVAGHQGVHHPIKWVTIVEVLEDIHRLQEGEFLITTGYGLMESEQKRNEFHKLLSMKKLSGVAIYTGFYLREIPDSFIELANRHALPLIEIPTDINFSMITKAILEQIVNNQMQSLEYSLSIHKQFTQLVLGSQGDAPITKTLSSLIQGSIILFNEFLEISHRYLIHDWIECLDDMRVKIKHREIEPVQTLQERVELQEQNVMIVIHPIIANEVNFGYIMAIKEKDEWQELDYIAIEHAATVYAIEYLMLKAVEETKIRLQGDFLEEIFNQNFKSESKTLERGKKLGFNLALNQAVLHIQFPAAKEKGYYLSQIISQIMKQKGRQAILQGKMDSVIVLTEVVAGRAQQAKKETIELAELILDRWNRLDPDEPLKIGIGRAYRNLRQLTQSAREAEYALHYSKLLAKSKPVIHYDDLGLYHLLIHMRESGVNLQQFYEEHLGGLIHRKGTDLLYTLETFLMHNQNIQNTAAELFIHRHTLKYRLKQIEKITGLNLQSADDRMKLQLALMAYKLSNV
ncbi:PucR family transcriptional regulator [Lihuaxuella thermophila]|uniref:Purine catabolism regulatory protein n=1 Tax=Lihuaxuella thermophila TaxID=1173111 RepID=A0A1H8IKD3_9BACL|nr:PucR family transcriptional regulator [Lihuaxuella thermophila]SEN69143.1 purine catabolism regulatory protein [Lihuaxuella thermophila]